MMPRRIRIALQHEHARRSLVWAGLLAGVGVLLEGVISTTAWIFTLLLLVAAMTIEVWITSPDSTEDDSGISHWTGPIAAGIIVGLAVVMRLLLAW